MRGTIGSTDKKGSIEQKMLPAGWSEHRDGKTGKAYFVHQKSGRTVWERPEGGETMVAEI